MVTFTSEKDTETLMSRRRLVQKQQRTIKYNNVSTIITLVVICLLCKTLEFILGFVLLFDFVSLVRIVESVMRNVKALSSAT